MGDILYEFMWELLSYNDMVIGVEKHSKQLRDLLKWLLCGMVDG